MAKSPFHTVTFAKVFPLNLAKVEKKGRSKAELDDVIHWQTGDDDAAIAELPPRSPVKPPSPTSLRKPPQCTPTPR